MRKLGIFIGAIERGYCPEDLNYIQGQADVWDREGGTSGRLLLKAARDVMLAAGRGHTAPAFHLHFLVKSGGWNAHTKEVAQDVARLLEIFEPMRQAAFNEETSEPMRKAAFNLRDVGSAGMAVGKGALLGSMALGGGLGTLYWLLSRHANQDSADIAAMQRQVDYYDQLARELEDSMRRKYHYDRGEQRPEARKFDV